MIKNLLTTSIFTIILFSNNTFAQTEDCDSSSELTLDYSCDFKFSQTWFGPLNLDEQSSDGIIEYSTKRLKGSLNSELSEVELAECDPRWKLSKASIASSPNLNNFKVRMNREFIHGKYFLNVELLLVHRDMPYNIVSSTSIPIFQTLQVVAIPIYIKQKFGPERSSVGTRQQSLDDYKEGSMYSLSNPGAELSGECRIRFHD